MRISSRMRPHQTIDRVYQASAPDHTPIIKSTRNAAAQNPPASCFLVGAQVSTPPDQYQVSSRGPKYLKKKQLATHFKTKLETFRFNGPMGEQHRIQLRGPRGVDLRGGPGGVSHPSPDVTYAKVVWVYLGYSSQLDHLIRSLIWTNYLERLLNVFGESSK